MSALTTLQVGSAISYLIAVALPVLDAIFPVLPSETAVIALGVTTAGSADPRIALLVACAAAGAFSAIISPIFLGRLGGKAFEDKPWAGFLVAFGGTVVITAPIEAARRIGSRRKGRRAPAKSVTEAERPGSGI